VEAQQGGGDDTALNGIGFKYCPISKTIANVEFDYNLDAAKITLTPETVKTSRTVNTVERDQKKTLTLSATRTETQSWTNAGSKTWDINKSYMCGVPFICNTGLDIKYESTTAWSTGKEVKETKTISTAD